MIRSIFILLTGAVISIALVLAWSYPSSISFLKPSEDRLLEKRLDAYLQQRLGTRSVRSMIQLSTTPTQNTITSERLVPQKIVAKLTTIGSQNQKRQLPSPLPKTVDGFGLPGMDDLVEPSAPSTANMSVAMANELAEQREQELNEHVFYNKDIQTLTVQPTLSAMSVAVFMPDSYRSRAKDALLKQELALWLHPRQPDAVVVSLYTIKFPPFLTLFYARYDHIKALIMSHPWLTILGLTGLILFGTLFLFARAIVQYKLKKLPKTVLIKEPPHQPETTPMSRITTTSSIHGTPDQLAHYLLKGVLDD